MPVFTIYCHGSGQHRDKKDDEIVCFAGRRATGTEYEDYLILDGVGGEPKTSGATNPLAGSFNWADKAKSPKGKTPAELGGGKTMGATLANVSGWGVDDNANHAVVTIGNLDGTAKWPTTVNLIGWSRGAVTCLVIANKLNEIYPQVKVNIFAFDPVAGQEAGVGEGSQFKRWIPGTVENYVCTLATGENRETFKPQDLSRVIVLRPDRSNVVFLPFPGKHSTGPKNNDPKAKEVSDICWTLAHRFFDHFGTTQSEKPVMLSNEQMLESYSTILVNAKIYGGIKQSGLKQRLIGKGFGGRAVAENLGQYTQHAGYFVNEHHRTLFETVSPSLYQWLFTLANAQGGMTGKVVAPTHPVGREIAAAWIVRPNFVASLERLGVSVEGTTIRLPAPGSAMGSGALHAVQARASLTGAGLM